MAVTLSGGTPTFTVGYAGGTIISGTSQASTSGTSIDFTSIPSWVKRVSILMNAVNTSGSSPVMVQIGSGSTVTSGYSSTGSRTSTAATITTSTAGFVTIKNAGDVLNGIMTIAAIGSNTWVETHAFSAAANGASYYGSGGSPALSGTLDRVRITTVNGTDTFNAGSINILYE